MRHAAEVVLPLDRRDATRGSLKWVAETSTSATPEIWVASQAHPRRCRAHGERASIRTATRMNDAATGETSLSNVFVTKCELSPTQIAAISIPLLIAWIHTVIDTFM